MSNIWIQGYLVQTLLFGHTANIARFSKFFHNQILEKADYEMLQCFLPHLSCVATLPCES